jgi:hypothetical protein
LAPSQWQRRARSRVARINILAAQRNRSKLLSCHLLAVAVVVVPLFKSSLIEAYYRL